MKGKGFEFSLVYHSGKLLDSLVQFLDLLPDLVVCSQFFLELSQSRVLSLDVVKKTLVLRFKR